MDDFVELYKKAKQQTEENPLNHANWIMDIDPITRQTIIRDPTTGKEISKEELLRLWKQCQKPKEW